MAQRGRPKKDLDAFFTEEVTEDILYSYTERGESVMSLTKRYRTNFYTMSNFLFSKLGNDYKKQRKSKFKCGNDKNAEEYYKLYYEDGLNYRQISELPNCKHAVEDVHKLVNKHIKRNNLIKPIRPRLQLTLKIVEDYANNMTIDELCAKYEKSRSWVYYVVKKYKKDLEKKSI